MPFASVFAGRETGPHPCPCCGYLTLTQRGGFELCPVCFWEDDGQDDQDADLVRGGPNGTLSLSAARANYREVGDCDRSGPGHVRPPRPDEECQRGELGRGRVQARLAAGCGRLAVRDDDGAIRWEVTLDADVMRRACFREARIWSSAALVCVGAAESVRFYDVVSGAPRGELNLDALRASASSQFGHFGEVHVTDGTSLLLILTYSDVVALDSTLAVQWTACDVALDGVTFREALGDTIVVGAEMDPPGGWFRVVLDAKTGRELAREPAFAPGYVGAYSVGSLKGE